MVARLRELFEEFSRPTMVVTGLEFAGLDVSDLVPREVSLLAAGEELFQVGRYRAGGPFLVRVSGQMLGESVVLEYPLAAAAADTQLAIVPRLWAHRKVLALESEVERWGANQELLDDILYLGLTYRLVTGRTALFAPDDQVVMDPQPRDEGGATAVTDGEAGSALHWAGHDFVWSEEGTWVDVRFCRGMPVVDVQALRRPLPAAVQRQLAAFGALGPGAIVVLDRTAYLLAWGSSIASELTVGPNAPNPFNSGTWIPFVLPSNTADGELGVQVYAITGQLVWSATIAAVAGPGRVFWDGRNQAGEAVASGVYLAQLRLAEHAVRRPLLLVR